MMDMLLAALAHPAGRLVDRPVRDLVHQILKDRGYASPEEVQELRGELDELRVRLADLTVQHSDLERRARDLARLLDQPSLGAAGLAESG